MQIKTKNCGGQGGERSVSRKKETRERGRKEEKGSLRTERKDDYEVPWEDGTAKKIVESLCLLRLRDGLHQKVAGKRWLLVVVAL
jgi:hypothetical protein